MAVKMVAENFAGNVGHTNNRKEHIYGVGHQTFQVQKRERLNDGERHELAEAALAAILEGGALEWYVPPARDIIEHWFDGVCLAPTRQLLVVHDDNNQLCGAAILGLPMGTSNLIAPRALLCNLFVAPYARNQGRGTALVEAAARTAKRAGAQVLNAEILESRLFGRKLLLRCGFQHWGSHPYYGRLGGRPHGPWVHGLCFSRDLTHSALKATL
ncbi:GNAT family N-acetyltransferase [Formicincola oecophyllae]|uniref:GNAT family N-acetyltransferase n=1 Tax=Formicincola oecophyllae TaxID=2558361 RepID=A0A4Y6U9L0_9PROT|nr:GNAT family N-acetyltransferase [Formicincola oecophyllae]QDH13238.1 GNAT family N-acetyltransferase [Formicincola oecophyllae]